MSRHQTHRISIDEIPVGYTIRHQLAGAFGKGENKELVVVIEVLTNVIHFEVVNHRNTQAFSTLLEAIYAYNEA